MVRHRYHKCIVIIKNLRDSYKKITMKVIIIVRQIEGFLFTDLYYDW